MPTIDRDMVRLLKPDHRRGRDYSSRREQLRLLLLIVPLGLVIILMARLRDPATADRINNFFTPPAADIKPPAVSAVERRPVVAEISPPRRGASIPAVPAELLKTIKDNTYFRTAEKDAWFYFLELVRSDKLDAAASVDVEYVQLVDQPDVYRGKLITVRGTARQITQEKPAANDFGLTTYYRVIIQPAENTAWPIIAYCLELPPGVAAGDNQSLDVAVTGLFFKKLSYQWRDGLGIAPVIVARTLSETPSPSERGQGPAVSVSNGEGAVAQQPSQKPSDTLNGTESKDSLADSQAAFQKILELSGWDAQRLAKFDDGAELSETQRGEALQLLRRLRSLDTATLDKWRQYLPLEDELKNPDEIRGQLRGLVGRVTKVTKLKPPADVASRLEMPEYFECQLALDNLKGPVTVLTSRVPNDWLRGTMMGGVIANALYLKQLDKETPARTLWLAKEIAWYPGVPNPAHPVSINDLFRDSRDLLLGKSLLGAAAMDVGQLDLVQARGRIRSQERDAFYNMLNAAGQFETSALIRLARDNLPAIRKQWQPLVESTDSPQRRSLAREIVRRAGDGQFSVAMLFNDPAPQIGRLFVFDGVAKRAVRVEVASTDRGENSNDSTSPHGIDHYYEVEVFTDDSQNYPLVFCVRELPTGFPEGSNIHVPVRLAGFFFKDWLYGTRGAPGAEGDKPNNNSGRAQYAPLLIGRAPVVLQLEENFAGQTGYVVGGLFLLALAGIWAAAAWYARDNKRASERARARRFGLEPELSLNDLNVLDRALPINAASDTDSKPSD